MKSAERILGARSFASRYRMGVDHFRRHAWAPHEVDWCFHVLFGGQPQVAEMAAAYGPVLDHPGLYGPIPPEWLHLTVLRVGPTDQITAGEMTVIVERLRSTPSEIRLPELRLGPCWVAGGNVTAHVTPEEPVAEVFDAVLAITIEILGERAPRPGPFQPHVALAYARDSDDDTELRKQLYAHWIDPVPFRASELSLVRQCQTVPFYSWDVVDEIPIR